MGTIFKGIVGFFANGIGQTTGKVVTVGAIAAALTPLVLWYYHGGKDETAVCYTYGQLVIPALFGILVVAVIYFTRPGSPRDRSEFRDSH